MTRTGFIDRTARKPSGKWAIKNYNNPRGHYRSFKIIMDCLSLNADDTFCEIGCGGGVLLNMALQIAKSAAGLDHSEDMVELAIQNNRENYNNGCLEIVLGDAEKLPWNDSSFSTCASANVFFFVEKPEVMLSEVFRVLKPGGRFSMVTMGNGLIGKISFGWIYKLKTYSNEKMMSMLSNNGFHNIKVKTGFGGYLQNCYAEKPF